MVERHDNYVLVRLWLYSDGSGVQVFDNEAPNCEMVEFTFHEMNGHSWNELERECLEERNDGHGSKSLVYSRGKMRMFYLRRMFRSWSFREPARFDSDGTPDKSTWRLLLSLDPKILMRLTDNVFSYTISQDDEIAFARQGLMLFGRHQSVSSPHPMISLYCTLADMWNKFGLNYFDIMRMPLYERNALRRILSIEAGHQNEEVKRLENTARNNQMRR